MQHHSKGDMAEALFTGGLNCAQSVLGVFCESYGLERGLAARLATGFGGGCRAGELCGAVTGGVLVVSLKHGQTDAADKEAKERCYHATRDFVQAFRTRHNACRCYDLLGLDISTPEGRQQAQPLFATLCTSLIRSAVELLEEQGY